jgi:hypothetical protein
VKMMQILRNIFLFYARFTLVTHGLARSPQRPQTTQSAFPLIY